MIFKKQTPFLSQCLANFFFDKHILTEHLLPEHILDDAITDS